MAYNNRQMSFKKPAKTTTPNPVPNTTTKFTHEQEAIFAFKEGNLNVIARAGTGKTTTLVEYCIRLALEVPGIKILMTSFNKKIADELASRMGTLAASATLHSVGRSFITSFHPKVYVNMDERTAFFTKIVEYSRQYWDLPDEDRFKFLQMCLNICAKTREQLSTVVHKTKNQAIYDIIDFVLENDLYSMNHPNVHLDAVASLVYDMIMEGMKNFHCIDFSDMIFLPLARKETREIYDVVVVDEAQDMTPQQLELALAAKKKDGRVILVFDPNQLIYSWRGASEEFLKTLSDKLQAKTLPLSITFRCPKKVVEKAKMYVSDYQAHDSAIDGEILHIPEEEMFKLAQTGDSILSRSNAPLVSACLRFWKHGKNAVIAGKDFGAQILNLIDKIAGKKAVTIADFLDKMNKYQEKEEEKLEKLVYKNPDKLDKLKEALFEKLDILRQIAMGKDLIADLKKDLQRLFSGDGSEKDRIVLSTVHKAKGLEWNRVFILEKTFVYQGKKKTDRQEFENICYVAITRTKRELIHVN